MCVPGVTGVSSYCCTTHANTNIASIIAIPVPIQFLHIHTHIHIHTCTHTLMNTNTSPDREDSMTGLAGACKPPYIVNV